MPVFINEVVVRGEVSDAHRPGAAPSAWAAGAVDREALIAAITQAVLEQLERERERAMER